MANHDQLEILKQGIYIWNEWMENKDIYRKVDLSKINLSKSNLIGVNLQSAILSKTNFRESILRLALFMEADLTKTIFYKADLRGADFSNANLSGANFREAVLGEVDLSEANLSQSDFSKAYIIFTIFGNTDLSEVIGLEDVSHGGPSTIGIDTIAKSRGKIPATFLRGCGLSEFEIESTKLYNPDLSNQEINDILYKIYDLRARQAIQVSPLFISYSHADAAFVDRLEVCLNEKSIRFWRDIHDAKAGRFETQIEQAIRHNPTVLVVLSKNAIQSDWVEHEVRTARGLEKELKHDVLCPVALDESWKSSPWPERVMEQIMKYNILDFSKWQDEQVFEQMFVRLLDGLKLFYKG